MLALTCLAFPLAFLQPPHPSQWGVQRKRETFETSQAHQLFSPCRRPERAQKRNPSVFTGWELPTLRERIHKGSVAKVGIHSSQLAVEVLDVNGIQRRVDIFPEATP
eukprot:5863362-Prymnesium_polylepis.2